MVCFPQTINQSCKQSFNFFVLFPTPGANLTVNCGPADVPGGHQPLAKSSKSLGKNISMRDKNQEKHVRKSRGRLSKAAEENFVDHFLTAVMKYAP